MMRLLSFKWLLILIPFLIVPAAADSDSICDRTDVLGQLARQTPFCTKEPEEPKHHGKGPQCRPGITTCKDRENRCCNDFVCELMCDPDEEDDEHEEEHTCGNEGDKDCSCRHSCEDGRCKQKSLFAVGKDEDGVCIMVAAKHANGTSKAGIKAPAKLSNVTSIPKFNNTKKRLNMTSIQINNATTFPKASEQRGGGTRKPSQRKPVPKLKSSPLVKPGTSVMRRQTEDSGPENLDGKYQICSGYRMPHAPCKEKETCLDIARYKDERACGGLVDGPSYCVETCSATRHCGDGDSLVCVKDERDYCEPEISSNVCPDICVKKSWKEIRKESERKRKLEGPRIACGPDIK